MDRSGVTAKPLADRMVCGVLLKRCPDRMANNFSRA